MSKRSILSAIGQVAQFLREDIQRGRWTQTIPGVRQLASELDVNRDTVNSALQQLEKEGLLINQGPGRQRKINRAGPVEQRNMRVMIQPYDSNCRNYPYYVEFRNQLQATGRLFDWSVPSVAHIDWNMSLIARHLMCWFESLLRGEDTRRMHEIKTRFFEGGTVGPAKS